VATGLAIAILGAGLSAFLGQAWVGKSLTPAQAHWGAVSDLPFVGKAFFSLHLMAYLTFALALILHWVLNKSRLGLLLRAIGENPQSAHALGYGVGKIRCLAALAGGAFCGVAGAYLSCVATPLWVEGMTAGRGWIALALTTFATWRPLRTAFGALLFGAVTTVQFSLQGFGVDIPSQLLAMLPYAATIVVLVLISRKPDFIKLNMPASLGKTFKP
jgi:simple sugar transport system permease protein